MDKVKDPAQIALMKSAIKLFAVNGLEGTTVREIAEKAGVNVALINYHFKNKEGLYLACIQEFGNDRRQRTTQLLVPANSFEEFRVRLSMLVREMLQENCARPEICQLILNEIDQGLPHARKIFEETFLDSFKHAVAFFEHGIKMGYISPHFNPAFLFHSLQAMVFHTVRTDKVRLAFFGESIKDPQLLEQTVDQIISFFINGACGNVSLEVK